MEEGAKVNCGCGGTGPPIDVDYWKQEICALLKQVDNIERFVLHVAPTTAQLRKAGMEKLGRQHPASQGCAQVDSQAGA
jgi:hypothetical protein